MKSLFAKEFAADVTVEILYETYTAMDLYVNIMISYFLKIARINLLISLKNKYIINYKENGCNCPGC